MGGVSLAGGWVINLITCLKDEFHFKKVDAAKIYNYVNGSITMFPIVWAIIADSYVGCFSVIWFSSLISLLGTLLLLLLASINQLKHSQIEYPILYIGLVLASLGNAGTRFTIAPMGADQLDNPKHQTIFFNWFIFTMYTANIISSTATVYVQENISWAWGFGLCILANVLGLALFLSGTRFYRLIKPKGSAYKNLARVIVAAIRKRKRILSLKSEDYYHSLEAKPPTNFFRFLNRAALITEGDTRAALITEGDTRSDHSVTNPWKLCSVQQVEDLKSLIKIFPIWITGVVLSIPIAIQQSLFIFQAQTMNCDLGSHLKVPAASMQVFTLIATTITIIIVDRLLFPLWERLKHKPLTALQRVGIGHFFTILSMVVSGIVESKRLKIVKSNTLQNQSNAIVPMSVFWLVPQLSFVGMAEALHFAGQVSLYYQEFPESLKSTSTAAVAMSIGSAFYLSNPVIEVIRRVSGWLPDNMNNGRLDNVYWFCSTLGAINFACYLGCTLLYKYQNTVKTADDDKN
ncbi:hypothetical protein RD792_010319 [Penstemon davidsonii]|uniref:Uncharacterized protein n=1 Tax=Penstemon davidsonii TaxID=160366 RepID=A0ABR0D1I5_9LAMI|nr:hypothetical protein RD792_010319 [Penstemon davidsonii]